MTVLCEFDREAVKKAYADIPQPICPDEAQHAEDMARISAQSRLARRCWKCLARR